MIHLPSATPEMAI